MPSPEKQFEDLTGAFRIDPITGERTFEVRPMEYAYAHGLATESSDGTRLNSQQNEDLVDE